MWGLLLGVGLLICVGRLLRVSLLGVVLSDKSVQEVLHVVTQSDKHTHVYIYTYACVCICIYHM